MFSLKKLVVLFTACLFISACGETPIETQINDEKDKTESQSTITTTDTDQTDNNSVPEITSSGSISENTSISENVPSGLTENNANSATQPSSNSTGTQNQPESQTQSESTNTQLPIELNNQSNNTTPSETQTDAETNNTNIVVTPLVIELAAEIEIEAKTDFTIPNLTNPVVSGGAPPYKIINNLPPQGLTVGNHQVVWQITDAGGQQVTAIQQVQMISLCDANVSYFTKNVWPALKNSCYMCHNQDGSQTAFNLVDDTELDQAQTNFDMFKTIRNKTDINGQSLLLVKPINANNDHGGGNVIQANSVEYANISTMVNRLQSCEPAQPVIKVDPIVLLDFESTLRKVSLQLIGRLPTQQETNQISQASTQEEKQQIFLQIVDSMLNEPSFIENLKIIINDSLLTNAYLSGTRGLSLRLNSFDNKKYFDNSTLEAQGYIKDDRNAIRKNASIGIATAALELIAYVVKENRPFTEILTADYVMVNPYSATVFSADLSENPGFAFVYGDAVSDKDPGQFLPVTLTDNKSRLIPHAGILTTLPFLSRFPSTPTNINRKRAATVFKLFLDTNIEGLASRTALDLDNVVGEFPTLEDPQCKVCHDVMDPIAGLFKNWNDNGEYRGDYTKWGDTKSPPQILSPGYSASVEDILPTDFSDKALSWFAQRIVADSRFATSISKIMFNALSGQSSLNDSALFESLKNSFIASNYNLKDLIKSILLTQYYRVNSVVGSVNVSNLDDLGTSQLLTPEQLDAKITSLTNGYQWKSPSNKELTDTNTYNILYGGIDSQDVTIRTTQPTGVIAAVQQRVAFQTSCETIPLDFSKPIAERNYFKFVEISDLPTDSLAVDKIKQNIVYLYQYLLGETQAVDSLEVQETFNLFVSAVNNSADNNIPSKCRGGLNANDPIIVDENMTVRGWIAVLSYLYLDYKFLYQ